MSQGTSYQVISDPEQVRQVLRRVDDFLPTNALTSVVPLSPAALRILSRSRFALPPVLASATGELHRTVRSVVAGFFTPAKVAAIGPRVRELTRKHAEAAAAELAHGPVDLAQSVGAHIPPVIMQELTGFQLPDPEVLKRWSRDSLELFWGWPDPQRQLELAETAAEFYTWLRAEVIASHGRDNLFGALHAAGLRTAEVCSLGYFLLIAGQETTALLIGTALYRALQDPACWQSLASGGTGSAAGAPGAGRGTVRAHLAPGRPPRHRPGRHGAARRIRNPAGTGRPPPARCRPHRLLAVLRLRAAPLPGGEAGRTRNRPGFGGNSPRPACIFG